MKDPSSHTCAAVRGWTRPWSNEAWLLADLLDIEMRVNTRRKRTPPRYPRPSDPPPVRYGATRRTQPEVHAALAARGHELTAA